MPTATSRADAGVAEDVFHEVREAIDHLGLVAEVRGAVDHSQALDQPHNLIERAEMASHGGQDRQSGLPGCRHARRDVQIDAKPAGDHRAIGTERAMAGDIEHVADSQRRHVGRDRLGRGGSSSLSSARRSSAPMRVVLPVHSDSVSSCCSPRSHGAKTNGCRGLNQRVRSRQCQGFPRNPGRFHPGNGLSPSLDQLGAIEREASFFVK